MIPSTLHRIIKFRWCDEIIVVMAESFDKEPANAISSVSQQTIRFDPKPSNVMYRVNRFELVNYIPDLECGNSLAVHSSSSRMVENICRRWGYAKGTPLGRHGQGIAEPIMAEEHRDFEGLGYDWQPRDGERLHSRSRKLVIPRDLTNFVSASVLDPNTSQDAAQ